MTPSAQGTYLEQLRTVKVLLLRCYLTEGRFALFLMNCLEKHRSDLTRAELLKLRDYSDRIHALLDKIKACEDAPPDKLPVYPIGGVPRYVGECGAPFELTENAKAGASDTVSYTAVFSVQDT